MSEQYHPIYGEEAGMVSPQLASLRTALAERTYPGYPSLNERFNADPTTLAVDAIGRLVVPDGPWTVDDHPDQPQPEHAPTLARQDELLAQGLELDSQGRPLHPWFLEMVGDAAIGVALGKGNSWEWGVNHTVDSMVVCGDHVLLIRRGDTGQLALPGGFRGNDTDEAAMLRELVEETGLRPDENARITTLYDGPVADIRDTANAWKETRAFLVEVPFTGTLPEVHGGDDATAAIWMPRREVWNQLEPLFGSHDFLLARGIDYLNYKRAMIDQIAGALHGIWLSPYLKPDGSYEPRIRTTIDAEWIAVHGTDQVNIANPDFDALPEDWQAENVAAAEVIFRLLEDSNWTLNPADREHYEYAGKVIHDAWLARNPQAKGGPLDVPFNELPESEQVKDINHVYAARSVLGL